MCVRSAATTIADVSTVSANPLDLLQFYSTDRDLCQAEARFTDDTDIIKKCYRLLLFVGDLQHVRRVYRGKIQIK